MATILCIATIPLTAHSRPYLGVMYQLNPGDIFESTKWSICCQYEHQYCGRLSCVQGPWKRQHQRVSCPHKTTSPLHVEMWAAVHLKQLDHAQICTGLGVCEPKHTHAFVALSLLKTEPLLSMTRDWYCIQLPGLRCLQGRNNSEMLNRELLVVIDPDVVKGKLGKWLRGMQPGWCMYSWEWRDVHGF